MKVIDQFVAAGVANDGLSGEKGLAGHSSGFPRTMAQFLALYNHLEPDFLAGLFNRHPDLHKTFRFHVDTWWQQGKIFIRLSLKAVLLNSRCILPATLGQNC